MHICVEGVNGSGKTTLIKNLSKLGYKTLSSPNGTNLAKYIRPACRGTDQWGDLSEMVKFLLFSAARCDEFDKLIKDCDDIILCDRWHFSTWVYQHKLGNIPLELYEMSISKNEKIDCVFILGGDSDKLIDRVIAEREKNPSHGICSWTQERETMKKINDIYKNELPLYLKSKNINYLCIDTIQNNADQVQTIIENYILGKHM